MRKRLIQAPDLTSKKKKVDADLLVNTKALSEALTLISKAVEDADATKSDIAGELESVQKKIDQLQQAVEIIIKTESETAGTVNELSAERQTVISELNDLNEKIKEISSRIAETVDGQQFKNVSKDLNSIQKTINKFKEDIEWLISEIDRLNDLVEKAGKSSDYISVGGGGISLAEAKAIKLDDFAEPDDNTDLDFDTSKHGLVPKGTNVGDYLKDDGTWGTPAGSGAGDMLAETYDPTGVEADVFDVDNHKDGTTNKVYSATEKTKLAGIESEAKDDQTGAEIKTAYEAEDDTNAYTDAEKTKLAAIEASATADQTKDDIDALGLSHDSLADVSTSDHHVKYTNAEAVAAAEAAGLVLAAGKAVEYTTPTGSRTASGIIKTKTAGAALVFGNACYVGTDGKMEKALADDAAVTIPATHLCISVSIEENATGLFLEQGEVHSEDDSWAWDTGLSVYLSVGTAGLITKTMPTKVTGNQVQVLGIAVATDTIYWNPSPVVVEYA